MIVRGNFSIDGMPGDAAFVVDMNDYHATFNYGPYAGRIYPEASGDGHWFAEIDKAGGEVWEQTEIPSFEMALLAFAEEVKKLLNE